MKDFISDWFTFITTKKLLLGSTGSRNDFSRLILNNIYYTTESYYTEEGKQKLKLWIVVVGSEQPSCINLYKMVQYFRNAVTA